MWICDCSTVGQFSFYWFNINIIDGNVVNSSANNKETCTDRTYTGSRFEANWYWTRLDMYYVRTKGDVTVGKHAYYYVCVLWNTVTDWKQLSFEI